MFVLLQLMEQKVEEDVEIVEKIVQELVTREVVEERLENREEPQVRMQYAYEGQGMQVAKGEVSDDGISVGGGGGLS